MTCGDYVASEEVYPDGAGLPDIAQVTVLLRAPYPPHRHVSARAVLDTGSSHTVLSQQLRDALQLLPAGSVHLVSDIVPQANVQSEYETCAITVFISGVTETTVEAMVAPSYPDVLLGRDVLNHLRLTLDAPVDLVLLGPSSTGGAP